MARRVAAKVNVPVEIKVLPWWKRAVRTLLQPQLSTIAEASHSTDPENVEDRGRSASGRLRPDMIRRVDGAPKLVDPSGHISKGHSPRPPAQDLSEETKVSPREGEQWTPEKIKETAQAVSEETEVELKRELDSSEQESDSSFGHAK